MEEKTKTDEKIEFAISRGSSGAVTQLLFTFDSGNPA